MQMRISPNLCMQPPCLLCVPADTLRGCEGANSSDLHPAFALRKLLIAYFLHHYVKQLYKLHFPEIVCKYAQQIIKQEREPITYSHSL